MQPEKRGTDRNVQEVTQHCLVSTLRLLVAIPLAPLFNCQKDAINFF